MHFYTNVTQRRNRILVCGYENGKRYKNEIKYKPYLFVPSKNKSKYKTIHGKPVDKITFNSINEAKEFYKNYEDVDNFEIYGLNNFPYVYIYDTFKNIKYDTKQIKTLVIDIEVSTADGYPDIESAGSEITAITMLYNDITFVLGYKDFDTDDLNVKYIKCKDEVDLLHKFIKIWSHDVYRPDVITGWNVEFFDIPYCVNRIVKVLGDEYAKKLSPWGILDQKTVSFMGRDNQTFSPLGISVLDYLQLYKKFTYTQQETYKLDHIAFIELGERKLDYSDYGSLNALYENDHQKFIEYNIRDCVLVKRLDDKMKLLDLVYTIAYDSGCNYNDSLATVKSWDVTIHNYLMDQNKVIPKKVHEKANRIPAGGFVKVPQTGMFDWIVSFDLTSLYPHIIMGYNISPDTYKSTIQERFDTQQLLTNGVNKYHDYLDENNLSFTANSCTYTKEFQGFLPALMEEFFLKRKEYKTKMLELKKKYEVSKSKKLEYEISKYDNLQMALKIRLNSAYGALANEYFRWFDLKYAESITLSGQLTIQWAEHKMNQYMNNLLKTENIDYCIASDTDSLYMNFNEIVQKSGMTDKNKIVSLLDKFCEEKVQPYLDQIFDELAEHMRAYKQMMFMKREGISDRGIFIAKKRYILNVHNNEGVQYDEPKLKMMGIEAVRSSTPSSCRNSIKNALKVILQGNEDDAIEYIEQFRNQFKTLSFEEISFPRGVNGLDKYRDYGSIYKKGTPIHVRGALLFNHHLKKHNLENKYEMIFDKEKIKFCYLKLPNPLHENVISVSNKIPSEFNLESYIDYDLQFEKSFLEPIKTILDKIGWKTEKTNSLNDFFN